MARTTVEPPRLVTGRVDTHSKVNVAAALDQIGGLSAWQALRRQPRATTSSSRGSRPTEPSPGRSRGHRLVRGRLDALLRDLEIEVLEVDRPNRQARRKSGKSDPIDAIEAARAALSGRASGPAKSRDGNVEAIQPLRSGHRTPLGVRLSKALPTWSKITGWRSKRCP